MTSKSKTNLLIIEDNETEIITEPNLNIIINKGADTCGANTNYVKEAKARYYQKKKAELGIEPKPKLTAEEQAAKKEQVAKANKKYYEKKKSKLLELGVMRLIQTEEEKKLSRKEANKRYYENRKLRNKEI